jgi:hypothetical protein
VGNVFRIRFGEIKGNIEQKIKKIMVWLEFKRETCAKKLSLKVNVER